MNESDFRSWGTSYGLSQQELGEKVCVTRTTIQNWDAKVGELSTMAANGVTMMRRAILRNMTGHKPSKGRLAASVRG